MNPEDQIEAMRLAKIDQTDSALALIDEALARDPDDFPAHLLRIKTMRFGGRLEGIMDVIDQAEEVARRNSLKGAEAELSFERGWILQSEDRLVEALEYFRKSAEIENPKVDYLSAVCSMLCKLGRYDEAVEWRHRILRMRNAEVGCPPEQVITAGRPKRFDPSTPERNIVSYSLFGQDRYYHECAITNARMHPVIFPEFTARFYCAPDLPEEVLLALRASGAQVMLAREDNKAGSSPMAGTFWRFLTFDDPNVDVVLCRDVDSPVLPRERAAIEMWLASSEPFYCMRDHAIHAELILAGLWGGFTGVLPPLGPLAGSFVSQDFSRFSDQKFLRANIWPRLREGAIMQIDDFASLDGSVPFPDGFPKHGRQHVGVSWTRTQILGPPLKADQ